MISVYAAEAECAGRYIGEDGSDPVAIYVFDVNGHRKVVIGHQKSWLEVGEYAQVDVDILDHVVLNLLRDAAE